MRRDAEWLLAAVLLGASGQVLHVATVSQQWLMAAAPRDRSPSVRWESVRIHVPGSAIAPGIVARMGDQVAEGKVPWLPVWGMGLALSAQTHPATQRRPLHSVGRGSLDLEPERLPGDQPV